MPASATLFRSLWRLTLPVATTAALAGCAAVSLDTPDWPPPPRYSAPARNATPAAAPSSAQAVAPVQAPPPAATATSEAIPAQPTTAAAPLPAAPKSSAEPWVGHYEGTQSCADCAGVRVILTLNQNNTYILSQSYMGSNALPKIMRGSFSWNNDETSIELDEKADLRRYAIGNNEVRQLNRDGSEAIDMPNGGVLKKRLH